MYSYKEIQDGLFVLSIDNHECIVAALSAFCSEKNVTCGRIGGLGAVSEATFRFLDPGTHKYVDRTFARQMEITNLTGNISSKDGKPYLHIHLTCSTSEYECVGGHLLEARVNGACELFVEDWSGKAKVGRRQDPETGLNLYDFSE
jgi:predicted DNA-binding protein with PD1-like motif